LPRRTPQRLAIEQAFEAVPHPLSADEVLAAARVDVPALGIATVYRHLRALTDEGWLIRLELPGAGARYERAGKEHHHHLLCRDCERLLEVDGCALHAQPEVVDGHRVEHHEVLLFGVCRDCDVGRRQR